MIQKVLLAIDDSPAALAATSTAVEVASACGAVLRAVAVISNHEVTELIRAEHGSPVRHESRERAAQAILRHAARAAGRMAVPIDLTAIEGEPAPRILDAARDWSADLIVIGRKGQARAGHPYIGGQTRHVLEFAEVPVLVIPGPC